MNLVRLVSSLLLAASPLAAAVSPGDSAAVVRAELGPPNGSVEVGQTKILFYDRGEVVVRDGVTMDVNLMTDEELQLKRLHDAERAALLSRVLEERRMAKEAEGLALKQSQIDSKGFQSLPAYERVAYWKQFRLKYPMVPIDLELDAAIAAARVEMAAYEKAMVNQAVTTLSRTSNSRSYYAGWYGIGIGVGGGYCPPYRPGYRPGYPIHPIHPGRPPGHRPDRRYSNPDYNSKKGFIMAQSDRQRGRIDAGYNANRTRIYRSISP